MSQEGSGGSDRVSYTFHAWQRLRTVCRVLRQTEENVGRLKEEIELKLAATDKATSRQAEVQATRISVTSLEQQLEIHRRKVLTAKARITKARICKEQTVSDSRAFEDSLSVKKEEVNEKQSAYIACREQLVRSSAQLVARRRQLLTELQSIYSIDTVSPVVQMMVVSNKRDSPVPKCQCKKVYRIAMVHVPDAEHYAGHNEQEISVGLGYCAHVLLSMSLILDSPLRYSLSFNGSRSALEDRISPQLTQEQRVVRLFVKGQDRIAFDYAVFLLNKNLAQLRCDCMITTADLRCTAENLKTLFEHLCGAKVTSLQFPRSLSIHPPSSIRSSRSSQSDNSSSRKTRGSIARSDIVESSSNSKVVPKTNLFGQPSGVYRHHLFDSNTRDAIIATTAVNGTIGEKFESKCPSAGGQPVPFVMEDDVSSTSGSSASNLEVKCEQGISLGKERVTEVA